MTLWVGVQGESPQRLIEDATFFSTTTSHQRNIDVASGGGRFVFVEPDRDDSSRARIEFLLNWSDQISGDGE